MLDIDVRKLTYEDNAGGVKKEFHNNLVNPGHSETNEFDRSIGSYRTGGKKAVFKLAEEAAILTRYRDPDGIEDSAYSVHLDKSWLEDSRAYQFKVYPFERLEEIAAGHTRFTFKLADDWGQEDLDEIRDEIQKSYSLLLVRSPNVEIYIGNRTTPVRPLSDLYKFSGANDKKIDIRPQRVKFTTSVEIKGKKHDLIFEVVLGCRTTSAASVGEDKWGIDIYGNDRLFIAYNQQELFDWFKLPKPNSGHLVRGLINIIGPNILVPWDTHKRHLTTDHSTIRLLKSKAIRDFFALWKDVYSTIGSGTEIKQTIRQPFEDWTKGAKNDIAVAFTQTVAIPPNKPRTPLPSSIRKPKVAVVKKDGQGQVEIKLTFTQEEFRGLCSMYEINRAKIGDSDAKKQLTEAIKSTLV